MKTEFRHVLNETQPPSHPVLKENIPPYHPTHPTHPANQSLPSNIDEKFGQLTSALADLTVAFKSINNNFNTFSTTLSTSVNVLENKFEKKHSELCVNLTSMIKKNEKEDKKQATPKKSKKRKGNIIIEKINSF